MKKLHYLVPTLIVALIGVILYRWPLFGPPAKTEFTRAQLGHDYYVMASLIELTERDPLGQEWDPYNGTGPDIVYEVYWKGQRIFKSAKKEDSFVARWTNAGIDLHDVAIGNATATLDSVVQAARINIREGERITIRVYDNDVMKDDLAGELEFVTTDLKPGEQTYEYQEPGVRRITLRVIDMQDPIDMSK